MGRRRHTPEQIITALREAEVGLANGETVAMVSRDGRALKLLTVLDEHTRPAVLGRTATMRASTASSETSS